MFESVEQPVQLIGEGVDRDYTGMKEEVKNLNGF